MLLQHEVDEAVALQGRIGEQVDLVRRRTVTATDAEQPVDLAADDVLPMGLVGLGGIEHEVVRLLDVGEPFGGRVLRLAPNRGHRIALGLDRLGQALDQRPRLDLERDADEAEHAGLADRRVGGGLARALHHQPGQLDHHRRILLGRLQEHRARHGQHFAVAQGDNGGGVAGAGDHGHLAGWLAWLDDAQELRLLAFFAADGAQATGAQEEQLVGVFARFAQGLAARQREPDDVTRHRIAGEEFGES